MPGVTFKITGDKQLIAKLERLSSELRGKTLERALVAGALIIQNDAKRKAPYLTGNLRRSIHIGGHDDLNPDAGNIVDRSGNRVPNPVISATTVAVYVGTDVNYAAAVEFGSKTQRAQPYLRPAVDSNQQAVAQEVGGALKDLIEAAVR